MTHRLAAAFACAICALAVTVPAAPAGAHHRRHHHHRHHHKHHRKKIDSGVEGTVTTSGCPSICAQPQTASPDFIALPTVEVRRADGTLAASGVAPTGSFKISVAPGTYEVTARQIFNGCGGPPVAAQRMISCPEAAAVAPCTEQSATQQVQVLPHQWATVELVMTTGPCTA